MPVRPRAGERPGACGNGLQLLGTESLGGLCPHDRWGDRAERHPDRPAGRIGDDAHGGDRDDHGVAGADLDHLLPAEAGRDLDGGDQLVRSAGASLRAEEELGDREGTGPVRTDQLDLGAEREQHRQGIAGGGGGGQVAAEGAGVADLGGAHCPRGLGHGGHEVGEGWAEQLRVGHPGAEDDPVSLQAPAAQLRHTVDHNHRSGVPPAEVDLDHEVGTAGEDLRRRLRKEGVQRLGQRPGHGHRHPDSVSRASTVCQCTGPAGRLREGSAVPRRNLPSEGPSGNYVDGVTNFGGVSTQFSAFGRPSSCRSGPKTKGSREVSSPGNHPDVASHPCS